MRKFNFILVTGGSGFVGSNFIKMMLTEHPEVKVINLDILTYAGNLENLKKIEHLPQYHFVYGSIWDRSLVK